MGAVTTGRAPIYMYSSLGQWHAPNALVPLQPACPHVEHRAGALAGRLPAPSPDQHRLWFPDPGQTSRYGSASVLGQVRHILFTHFFESTTAGAASANATATATAAEAASACAISSPGTVGGKIGSLGLPVVVMARGMSVMRASWEMMGSSIGVARIGTMYA